jgi:type II secretory pathway pseudopilin PulG
MNTRHPQRGFVLITALVFLTLVSLLALTAMRDTALEQEVAKNMALKSNTLDASEAGRDALTEVFDAHAFYRGWPPAVGGTLAPGLFTVDAGLTILRDHDADGRPDRLYEHKPAALASGVDDLSHPDAVYDPANAQARVRAQVFVFRNLAQNAPGAAAAMVAGYEGTGKGSAGSGGRIFFDLRSRSVLPYDPTTPPDTDPDNDPVASGASRTLLNNDFRLVVRN